jgi:rubrerythrin
MKETLKNLTKAYLGECQARNRYTFYAKQAQKEGYEQLAEIFLLTSQQEKTHAKRLFELINTLKENDEEIKVESSAITILGDTVANLNAAIAGETYENEIMYPEFAKVAGEEGYPEISARLLSIAIAELNHKERYMAFLKNIKDETVFKKGEKTWWVCRECGYIHFSEEAPKKCPSCDHPQSFYEPRVNY